MPAVLYYAALFVQADLEAARHGITRVPQELIPHAAGVLRAGWYFPIPFAVLIGGIFSFNLPLEQAALYSTLLVVLFGLVLGYRGRRLGLRDLFEVVRSTGLGVLDIFMIAPLAGIVIGVLSVSGLSFTLALSLVTLAGGSTIVLLLLTGGVNIVLGMGMPTVGVYILLATLVAPALIHAGIEPMAAHLFILYYGMLSMITPPVAVGAFAAASISGADAMRTGYAAMRFGWSAFVIPFLFIYSPTLLFRGSFGAIALDTVTALAGVWFVSAGLTGYSIRLIGAGPRAAYVIAGIALLIPVAAFPQADLLNFAGLALAAATLGTDVVRRRATGPGSIAATGAPRAPGIVGRHLHRGQPAAASPAPTVPPGQ